MRSETPARAEIPYEFADDGSIEARRREESVLAFEDAARTEEASPPMRAARRPDCAAQPRMHAFRPAAVAEVLDDAGCRGAGDPSPWRRAAASCPRATPTAKALASAPTRRSGENRSVYGFGRRQSEPAEKLGSGRESREDAFRRSPSRSAAARTAGTITAPEWTGPPSNVSSKSSPCAPCR